VPADTAFAAGVAGRYATALFELAQEGRALDAVAGDLERLVKAIETSAELDRLVRSPIVSREVQAKAVNAVIQRLGCGDLTRKLVGLCARKRRLAALPGIAKAFKARLAHHRGETFAEVVSAEALKPQELAAVKAELAKKAGREVSLVASVDPALIGGLVVKLGARMYDASLRTRLQSLKLAMKEAG